MKVELSQDELGGAAADLVAIGLLEGGELPAALAGANGASDVPTGFKRLSILRPDGSAPVLVVGLGKREELDAEKLRVAAAVAAKEAGRLEASSLAWALPEGDDAAAAVEALVTGTILATYRFDRFRAADAEDSPRLESLTLLAPANLAEAAQTAGISAAAQNRARDLQSTPANVATPTFLATRAEEIAAATDSISAEILGPAEIERKGMGGLLAVSQGGPQEPRMIVLRYTGGGSGPTLGLIGKGVTFDTGGISLKPGAGMQEMKMDMSGAAAVLEAVAAIAELGLPIDLIAVVPATENMPSGTAVKPGDVITQYNGKTVEVNNTDAEGRLILADALAYAVELGAERLVDLATLTGAVTIALGSTYAAVISNDDALAGEVIRAGEESGELTWRLPLHPEYKELMKGTVADLSNLASKRKAGTITAASFLEEFVDDTPWAHIDIAGVAWDVGREYTGNDANGFGVRLLVKLARHLSAE
ncbi:MAG TPA: leucyl aminopeptidase [Solirubrobacterales bacterium]|jgi:leucyl aminopeptidase|nr:leucyl aminopeptidase [Solirubrobacterales bacterium]